MLDWFNGIYRSVRRSIHRRGWRQTAVRAIKTPARLSRSILNPLPSLRDFRMGLDTAGQADLENLKIHGENAVHGNIYHPSSWESARCLLGLAEVRYQDFDFVDVGAGKGLVLLAAAAYPFRRIVGVEFAEELCLIAQRNVALFRGSKACADIRVVCADAAEYRHDEVATVFYLFNPFDDHVLAAFVANLEQSLQRRPREVVILYNGRGRHALFDRMPGLVRSSTDPTYAVYRLQPPQGASCWKHAQSPRHWNGSRAV